MWTIIMPTFDQSGNPFGPRNIARKKVPKIIFCSLWFQSQVLLYVPGKSVIDLGMSRNGLLLPSGWIQVDVVS